MEQSEQKLLDDLYLHGAALWEDVYSSYDKGMLASCLKQGYLRVLETPLGLAAVLGSSGRKLFGRDGSYKLEPNAAATQILLRGVRDDLKDDGWKFNTYYNHRKTIAVVTRETESLYVHASYPDPRVQTVERYLKDGGMRRAYRARFMLAARDIKPYRRLGEKYSHLHCAQIVVV